MCLKGCLVSPCVFIAILFSFILLEFISNTKHPQLDIFLPLKCLASTIFSFPQIHLQRQWVHLGFLNTLSITVKRSKTHPVISMNLAAALFLFLSIILSLETILYLVFN